MSDIELRRARELSSLFSSASDDDKSDGETISDLRVLCMPRANIESDGSIVGINLPLYSGDMERESLSNVFLALENQTLQVPCVVRTWAAPPIDLMASALPSLGEDFRETISSYAARTFEIDAIPTTPGILLINSSIGTICSIKWAILIGRLKRHRVEEVAKRLADAAILLSGEEFRDFLLSRNLSDTLIFSGLVTKWSVMNACAKAAPLKIDPDILVGNKGEEVRCAHLLSLSLQFALATTRDLHPPHLNISAYIPLPLPPAADASHQESNAYDSHFTRVLAAYLRDGYRDVSLLRLLGTWLVKKASQIISSK